MSSDHFVAGVDSSTQSTKVLVVAVDSGEVVAEGRAPHEVSGSGGARETDPDQWRHALRSALGATGRSREIAAIGVGGQQHGLVLLDGVGRPLRPAMLWNDTRSAPQAEELTEALGGREVWAERIGVVPVASFTVTKWQWVRQHEPDIAAAAKQVMLPHDYLNYLLIGHAATDRGDASGTGWWSTRTERYEPMVLDPAGIDPIQLPRVVPPAEAAGEVSAEAVETFSLQAGTLVAAGTGDNAAAALGLGLAAGEPVVSLGTSGTAFSVSSARIVDPTGTVAGFADAQRGYLPLVATLNCTQAVDRMAAWLGLEREAAADHTDVVVLPYLDGERTPNLPRASGTVVGLRHTTTAQEVLLAAYQGAAASLLEALEHIDQHGSGIGGDEPLILIGGGARGRTWQRVISSMSGRQLLIPEASELVARGGAVQAAAILTGTPPNEVARRWNTRAGRVVEPVAADEGTLAHIRTIRAKAMQLLEG